MDGARLELAFHGCRPWVIPLYEPPIWGEMRESNSRDWSHNPVPKPFGQSRHRIWSCSAGFPPASDLLTRLGAFVCRPQQQTLELARSLELRSGAYRAPALPVELYQRSWRGDSNADHGLTRPALFPLSYTSNFKTLEAVGRIALPMICFAGRRLAVLATPPQIQLGAEGGTRTRALDVGNVASWPLDDFRLERAARVELASSGWRPEAPAAIPCSLFNLAGVTGFEPA